jgi:hypothetical protein
VRAAKLRAGVPMQVATALMGVAYGWQTLADYMDRYEAVIRMVRFARSAYDVLMCFSSGSPVTTRVFLPVQTAGL